MRRKYTLQKGTDRRSAPAMDPVNAPAMMDYCGSFVYTNSQLSTILMDEGRIAKEDDNYRYEIFLKDHLGNTRAVISDAGDGITQIHQESHYYPFGLKMPYISKDYTATNTNKYQYNGKEKLSLNNENNIFWYDYGARMYDPAVGRWHVIDNKAEKYYSTSTYTYALNNPIIFVDPDGNEVVLGVAGLIGGAVFEMGAQVVAGMATGQRFTEALGDVDYADVAISALEYGTAGLTNGASLAVSGKISDALQASVDINKEGEISSVVGGFNNGEPKSLTEAGTEFVVGKAIGAGTKKAGKCLIILLIMHLKI